MYNVCDGLLGKISSSDLAGGKLKSYAFVSNGRQYQEQLKPKSSPNGPDKKEQKD